MASATVMNVHYCCFFSFPHRPNNNKDCVVKCKICSRSYKYTLTTKGNFYTKHLQVSHGHDLDSHKDNAGKV